jgi:hypothetical protein
VSVSKTVLAGIVAAVTAAVTTSIVLRHLHKASAPGDDPTVTAFLHEADILNSITQYGVDYTHFNEQLAKTAAAFKTVERSPTAEATDALKFSVPVQTWELASRVWKLKLRAAANGMKPYLWHAGKDLDLLNEAVVRCGYAPFKPDEDAKTSIDALVRQLLTAAGEDYERALKTKP